MCRPFHRVWMPLLLADGASDDKGAVLRHCEGERSNPDVRRSGLPRRLRLLAMPIIPMARVRLIRYRAGRRDSEDVMNGNDGLSYADAGVDIDAGNALVARIAPAA